MRRSLGLFVVVLLTLSGGTHAGADAHELQVNQSRIVFSPNGDDVADTVEMSVHAPTEGTLAWRITSAESLVREQTTQVEVGEATFVWDGLDDASDTVADGRFLVEAVLSDADDNLIASGQTSVTVDTAAPWIRSKRVPNDPVKGTHSVRFSFVIADRDTAPRAIVALFQGPTRIEGPRLLPHGPRNRTFTYRPRSALTPGSYSFVVTPVDRGGNPGRRVTHTFRVQRSMPGVVTQRLERARGKVALTFDDCYDRVAWRRILRTLRAMRAAASFFCPGSTLVRAGDLPARTVADGHSIGAHGWDHPTLARRSTDFVHSRLSRDRASWWNTARAASPYMRPPYGSYDSQVVRISGQLSMPRVIMWDVDPQDWRRPGAGAIASHVRSRATHGSIVVLHTLGQTADALPAMIRGLRARGLEPVSLDTLFRAAR